MATAPPPRVLIVEDHVLVAEALAARLSATFDVADPVHNARDAIAFLRRQVADCVVLDLHLPDVNGLELIPTVRQLRPEAAIVILTMLLDRAAAVRSIAAGAKAYVPKDAPLAELMHAINDALAGRSYVSPHIPKVTHRVGLEAPHPALWRLTPRQCEILGLVGQGCNGLEISRKLNLCPSTITFHKHNIMRALGVSTDEALRRYALLACEESSRRPGN